MYDVNAPAFPDYIDSEFFHIASIRLPAFAGMQVRNGPYGGISDDNPSTGETHAVSDKELDPEIFRTAVTWVMERDHLIRPLVLAALVDEYWEVRDIVIDTLIDEDPDDVVPEIQSSEDLAPLCGIINLHIGGMTSEGQAIFGIELGCNWEEEHGAGVRFEGLKVVEAGMGDAAYRFVPLGRRGI